MANDYPAANAKGVTHLHIHDEDPKVAKELMKDVSAGDCYNPIQHKAKLGTGARFASVEASARASGAQNPAAVAAAAGRKAHGQKAMTRYSQMGRKK
jgi:hypothetical protein